MVPLFYYNLYNKEVKMPPYTSFISDVHKSYRIEKIVLHHLIFLLSRLVVPSVYWFQTQFIEYKAFIWQKDVK